MYVNIFLQMLGNFKRKNIIWQMSLPVLCETRVKQLFVINIQKFRQKAQTGQTKDINRKIYESINLA